MEDVPASAPATIGLQIAHVMEASWLKRLQILLLIVEIVEIFPDRVIHLDQQSISDSCMYACLGRLAP